MTKIRVALAMLRADLRTDGLLGLVRKRGWRFVLAVVAAYLVKDLVLYVLVPAAIWMVAAR
jgi:hypothetical protein